MADQIECTSLQGFLEEISRAGVRSVVLRSVREIRPRHLENHAVEIGPQQWVELAGYRDGCLIVARLRNAEGDGIRRELESRGLAVKAISGNIT